MSTIMRILVIIVLILAALALARVLRGDLAIAWSWVRERVDRTRRGWSAEDAVSMMRVENERMAVMTAWLAEHHGDKLTDIPEWYQREHAVEDNAVSADNNGSAVSDDSEVSARVMSAWVSDLDKASRVLRAWVRRGESYEDDLVVLGRKQADARMRTLSAEYRKTIAWLTDPEHQ